MPPEHNADLATRRIHVIEPELQQPLPRRVRLSTGMRVLRGLALVAALLGGATFLLGWFRPSHESFPIGVLVGGFASCVLLVAGGVELTHRRSARLTRYGTATVGVVLDAPGLGTGDAVALAANLLTNARVHTGTRRVAYRYRTSPNEWREATIRVPARRREAGHWTEPGNSVTVLFDPTRPKRHMLYFTLHHRPQVLPLEPASPAR